MTIPKKITRKKETAEAITLPHPDTSWQSNDEFFGGLNYINSKKDCVTLLDNDTIGVETHSGFIRTPLPTIIIIRKPDSTEPDVYPITENAFKEAWEVLEYDNSGAGAAAAAAVEEPNYVWKVIEYGNSGAATAATVEEPNYVLMTTETLLEKDPETHQALCEHTRWYENEIAEFKKISNLPPLQNLDAEQLKNLEAEILLEFGRKVRAEFVQKYGLFCDFFGVDVTDAVPTTTDGVEYFVQICNIDPSFDILSGDDTETISTLWCLFSDHAIFDDPDVINFTIPIRSSEGLQCINKPLADALLSHLASLIIHDKPNPRNRHYVTYNRQSGDFDILPSVKDAGFLEVTKLDDSFSIKLDTKVYNYTRRYFCH